LHICGGCCNNREEAIAKGQKLIEAEVLKPLPLPAINKWTKVAPTVAHIALLQLFHNGWVVEAFKTEFGELVDDESDLSNEEDRKLEVPVNESRKWRVLARRRNMRATNFLSESQSLWINLLWCHLASGCMSLHARLFKNATWFTDRSPRELSRARHLLGTFCDLDTNPAWANLKDLLGVLENPQQHLCLLVWKFGPLDSWPQPRRRIVRKAIMVMTGQLARKLILPWQQYPWRLWPLALQDVDECTRQACAQALLTSHPCCLDHGFSKRLKDLHPCESELLSTDVRKFLAIVFERVALTSTFIERRFAQYTNWCDKQPKLSTLAAKHITSVCKGVARVWKDKQPGRSKPCHRSRPCWAQHKIPRTTGFNVFQADFRKQREVRGNEGREGFVQEATAAWRQLNAGEKASYSLRARGLNALRKRNADSMEEAQPEASSSGGLWGMCRLEDPWPMSAEVLAAAMGEGQMALNKIAANWDQASGPNCVCNMTKEI
jgi:hypothetical protein